jgi:hypothetical protein
MLNIRLDHLFWLCIARRASLVSGGDLALLRTEKKHSLFTIVAAILNVFTTNLYLHINNLRQQWIITQGYGLGKITTVGHNAITGILAGNSKIALDECDKREVI